MGVRSLLQNAAFLLAFNDRIASLHITEQGNTYELRKMPDVAYREGRITIEAIEELHGGETPTMRFVAVLREGDVVVAVELAAAGTRRQVLSSAGCPGIFKAFPLTATVQFSLPVIVNSEALQPRENRDTVFLEKAPTANFRIEPYWNQLAGLLLTLRFLLLPSIGITLRSLHALVHCNRRTGWMRNGFGLSSKTSLSTSYVPHPSLPLLQITNLHPPQPGFHYRPIVCRAKSYGISPRSLPTRTSTCLDGRKLTFGRPSLGIGHLT